MGTLHKGVCFSSLQEAQQAFCSDFQSAYFDATGAGTVASCTSVSQVSYTITRAITSKVGNSPNFTTSYSSLNYNWPAFQSCDYSASSDLILDYFAAALVLFIVVFGAKRLLRIFDTPTTEQS
jgi:hypothetical protein